MNIAKIRRKTAQQYADIQNKDSNTLYLVPDKGKIYLGDTALGGDTIEVMDPIPASPEDAGKIVKYINTTKQTLEGIDWEFGNYYKIGSEPSETVVVEAFESGTQYMSEEIAAEITGMEDTYLTPIVEVKGSIPSNEHIITIRNSYEIFGIYYTVTSITNPVNQIKSYDVSQEVIFNLDELHIIKNIEIDSEKDLVFYVTDDQDNIRLLMPISGNTSEQTITLPNNDQIKCLMRCFDVYGEYGFIIQFVDIDSQHDVVSSLNFVGNDVFSIDGNELGTFSLEADYDFTQLLYVNIYDINHQLVTSIYINWSDRPTLQSDEINQYMNYYGIVTVDGNLSDYTKCVFDTINMYIKNNQGYMCSTDMFAGTASLSLSETCNGIIEMVLSQLQEGEQPVWNTFNVSYPNINVICTNKHLYQINIAGDGNAVIYDLTDINYNVNTLQYTTTNNSCILVTSPTTVYVVPQTGDSTLITIQNQENNPIILYKTNIYNSVDDIAALTNNDMYLLLMNSNDILIVVQNTTIGYTVTNGTVNLVTLPYEVTDYLSFGGVYNTLVYNDVAHLDLVNLHTLEERVIVNDPTILYAIPAVQVINPVPANDTNSGRVVQYIGQYTNQYGIEWINGNTYKIGSATTNTICIEHPMYITTYPIESGLDKGGQVIQYLGENQTLENVDWIKGGVYRIGTTKPEYNCEIEFNEVMQQPISNLGNMLNYPILYSMGAQIITYNEDDNELYAHVGELNNTISIWNTIVDSGINSADFNSECVWVENEDNEFSLVFDNTYTSLETKQFTINNVIYSIQITSIISGENSSGYNAWTRCKITDSNLKQSIAGFVINTGLYPIDSNLLDSELIIPSTSFKVQLQNGDQSDEIETTITPAIDVETGDPIINLVPMEITPVSGYKFIKALSGLVLYNESTGVLYDIILERDVNLIAHPSSEYKVMVLGGQPQAISNLLYMTNPLYSDSENETGNYLAVTSDNKIVEYTLDQNTNNYIEVHTYTDVDLSYTYTLINPVIIGYKPTGNDIVVYNREDYSVTYSQIPTSLKPNNVKIERSLEMIYVNSDTNENVVAILGFKLQGIEDYFIYTSDGIHFFKFDDVPPTAKILTTGYLNALSIVINGSTLELALISSITTCEDPTVKLFQACEDSELSNYYTKTEADTALNGKADSATTISGYGITDAYTKTEVDTSLSGKANNATTLAGYGITDAYTKTEVNTVLGNKANTATTLAGYGITDANINSGVITLGSNTITPITSHQSLASCEAVANKVTSISGSSTDTQYPSAKCLYDLLDNLELVIAAAINNLNDRVTALENNP